MGPTLVTLPRGFLEGGQRREASAFWPQGLQPGCLEAHELGAAMPRAGDKVWFDGHTQWLGTAFAWVSGQLTTFLVGSEAGLQGGLQLPHGDQGARLPRGTAFGREGVQVRVLVLALVAVLLPVASQRVVLDEGGPAGLAAEGPLSYDLTLATCGEPPSQGPSLPCGARFSVLASSLCTLSKCLARLLDRLVSKLQKSHLKGRSLQWTQLCTRRAAALEQE